MLPDHVYHDGCFTVPPRFDFKILPLRSQKITVISFIGECDSFLGDRLHCNIPEYPQHTANKQASNQAYIDGFYDCQRQIIYLTLNNPGWENVLGSFGKNSKSLDDIFRSNDYHTLKLIYFLFVVSHFIVVTSTGTKLDPDYVRKFKLIEKLRIKMHPFITRYIQKLPLPCDWLASGRASVPRLLFLFKLSAPVALKFVDNLTALRDLERNIASQIFNTFYETGLIGSPSGAQLFTLPGHHFVHVHLVGVYSSRLGATPTLHDDLAQEFLQLILNDLQIKPVCGSTTVDMPDFVLPLGECAPIKSKPSDFPPPDQPEQHTFPEFLHLHVTNLLEQVTSRAGASFEQHSVSELPMCKSWFMACYKLYTSLMCEDASLADVTADSKLVSSRTPNYLSHMWHQMLLSTISRPTAWTSNIFDAAFKASNSPDSLQSALIQTDPLVRLSEMRCRAALIAAEAHYKQDLPLHYSNTYHLVKVVSAINVFISLARGRFVYPALEHLTKRLTHLYLAGRVTCSAVSLTGLPCQHELHRLPDDGLILRDLLSHYNEDSDFQLLAGFHPPRLSVAERELKANLDSLVPQGLTGSWRSYWAQSLLADCSSSAPAGPVAEHQPSSATTVPGEENDHHLTVLPHQSTRTLISACSCGRQQAERADPFDYKDANWRFYSLLARVCCCKLTSLPLAPQFLCEHGHPFVVPSESGQASGSSTAKPVVDSKASAESTSLTTPVAVLTRRMAQLDVVETRARASSQLPDSIGPGGSDEAGLSQPEEETNLLMLSSGPPVVSGPTMRQSNQHLFEDAGNDRGDGFSETDVMESGSSRSELCASSPSEPSDVGEDEGTDKPLIGCRRLPASSRGDTQARPSSPNTGASLSDNVAPESYPVRFREGVPTTGWLIGDFPRYPSWSIYALGKYFSYSHSSGLSCRGFLRNSNFLLPWDVNVGSGVWADRGAKHGRGGKYRGNRGDSDTVKLFIGFEMECPLGHRFFLAGPERAMDGPMQSNQVRRAVHDLLNRDLPLFMPCRCQTLTADDRSISNVSDRQPIWAQLTRIYLAIPSVPIRVRFRPRVRPGPVGTPIFHLGHTLDQCSGAQEDDDSSAEDSDRDVDEHSDGSEMCYVSHKRTAPSTVGAGTGSNRRQRPGFVWLNNAFLWVLRLPFAYDDGTHLYQKPTSTEQLKEWILLKGCIKLHV